MKPSVFRCLFAVAGLLVAGCGESSPSSPSDVDEGLRTVEVRCPEFGEDSRCAAYGREGQDVTGLATWSTSDPAIATITNTGLVTARATGEISIRASYQGATAFRLAWVGPGRGIHGTSRTLEGMVLSMNGPLPGVVMQILNGPNANRTMTTSPSGRFLMTDLRDGPFTIRLSKAGYQTAEYGWSIPGGRERIPTLSVAP